MLKYKEKIIMKKTLLLLTALLVLPLALFAAERVVVLEVGTYLTCSHCPKVAQKAHGLAHDYPGEILVVEYHRGDLFSNIDGENRISFYGISGYPTSFFDGVVQLVGDGAATLDSYEPTFLDRRAIASPLEITLEKTYGGAYFGEGTVTATIVNVSEDAVTGYIRFTVTETNIPYQWQAEDSIYFAQRDMLPDANGKLVTIEPGDTLVEERNFVTFTNWNETTNSPVNVELGCFVQAEDKEICQAAVIPVAAPISATVVQTEIDNETGMLGPWVEADFYVTLHNTSEEAWENLTGVLSTEDQYVTVQDSDGSWGLAEPDATVRNDEDPFVLKCSMSCPEGHRPDMTLVVEDDYGQILYLDFQVFEPVAVAEGDAPGFSLSVPGLGNGLVALSIPAAADAEISLIDASGRRVQTLHKGELNPGLNLISLPDDLASGAYFVKAEVGSRIKVAKLLILH
jgi:thiol-disulfide isomerase/thioredoxin